MNTSWTARKALIYLVLCLLLKEEFCDGCSQTGTTELIQINITCDHYLDLYVDGSLVSSDVYPNISKKIINVGSKVIAVNCRSGGESWIGSIISSLSNGIVTDKTWQCSTSFEHGWNMPFFDEYGWKSAVEHGSNIDESSALPYEQNPDVSKNAKFIWSSQQKTDKNLYCRRSLVSECNEERHRFFKSTEEWKNKVYSGSIMLTAATTSTLECALKCLGTPECGSFNYEFLRKEVQKCELNRGKSASHINLVSRNGFQYFEISKAGY